MNPATSGASMSLADQQQWCPTSVQVTVQQARGLRTKGKSGTNDAYALMQVGKEKFQTSVVEKCVAPVWKEEATFDLPAGGGGGGGGAERCVLHVHVLHRALVGPDKLLGQAVINLLQLSEDTTRNKTEWFKLLDKTGKADKDRGEVLVNIQFMRNNMTASMFDLSAAGKSRSRLGKFKDKVRGKKKESDTASNVAPTLTQVLTDSEGEENGDGEVAEGKDEKKKKHKMKSLFSPKSNLQKNMSQSMSVLPPKNSSLSGSQSSGLNVDSSEGKKKFKFKIHKRSGSSGNKDSPSGHQKQGAVEQSNLCINGSHVYCEEPPPRTSRIGSNFSIASSGHGSMEDVPESSPPSVDSLRGVRQYSPWTEEEEENIKEDVGELRGEEEEMVMMEEEERRRKEEEEERARRQEEELAEEKRRQEEEVRKEEEERIRREEVERALEERRRQEEKERVRLVELERERLAEERRRQEEQERKRIEEEERAQEERRRQEEEERLRREEEERERLRQEKRKLEEQEKRRIEEVKRQREEEERAQEERRRQEEDERLRREEEERERLREEKRKLEEQEKRRIEEVKRQREEEERAQEERRRQEEEERLREEEEERERLEKEKRRQEEQERRIEEERIRKEEEERAEEEKRRRHEEEEMVKRLELKRRLEEQEKRQREEEERIRMEEERAQEERRRQEEEELKLVEEKRRQEEEKRRKEEEERAEEEKRRREEEEMMRRQEEEREEKRRLEEQERRRREKEERIKKEEEERARMEKEEFERLVEEKRKQEEEERKRVAAEEKIRKEEEERIRLEEERRRKEEEERERLAEEKRKLEEQERKRIEEVEKRQREEEERIRKEEERRQEEEERARKEKEEHERLVEEKKRKDEQERKRMEEEEKIRREKEAEEEARKLEKEMSAKDAGEQKTKENKTKPKAPGRKPNVAERSPAGVASTNPFDEDFSDPAEEILDSPDGPDSSTAKVSSARQRIQSAESSVRSNPVSTDEKDPISTQREKRPAPRPPGSNQAERQSQREQDASTRHLAQINKQSKDKDVKTVSVLPQRLVQMIAPLSRSPTDAKNTQSLTQSSTTKGSSNAAKQNKRPAPSRPRSAEEEPPSEHKTAPSSDGNISNKCASEAKQPPIVYGLNPFEDDEDENAAQDDTTSSGNTTSVQWPPAVSQAADKDAASSAKIKSSKTRAPPVPALKAATLSTAVEQNADGGHVTDETGVTDTANSSHDPETVNPAPDQDASPQESQSAGEEAGGKKEGPPVAPRRLQPVKPLNPLAQRSVSAAEGEEENKSTEILCEVEKTKVNGAELKGPFSQLTQEELISLVIKQETQLANRDKKISELEQYIDNLLVRVMEENPAILMSLSAMK